MYHNDSPILMCTNLGDGLTGYHPIGSTDARQYFYVQAPRQEYLSRETDKYPMVDRTIASLPPPRGEKRDMDFAETPNKRLSHNQQLQNSIADLRGRVIAAHTAHPSPLKTIILDELDEMEECLRVARCPALREAYEAYEPVDMEEVD